MTDSGYVAKQDGATRWKLATLRIKEKIAVLEKWFEDGVPDDYQWHDKKQPDKKFGVPTNLSEFHKWNDPELKLTVKVDDKKHNVDGVYSFTAATLDKSKRSALKVPATDLLRDIKKRPTAKKELGKVKAQKKSLQIFTRQLVNENVELNAYIEQLQQYLEEAKDDLESLRKRVENQDKDLRKIRPIGPRQVK